MVQKIGIDFGTTNSLISVVTRAGKIKSFTDIDRPHPSVIRYENEQILCGREAREKLETLGVGVLGNTVRGPKKLLGIDHLNVDGHILTPIEVITHYIRFLINHAEKEDIEKIADLTHAVVTIPVALDGRGRQALREALLNAGVYIETFVHEPLAALYAYFKDKENTQNNLRSYEGKFILVFDWGGGTLDITLCKIVNGTIAQILNRGNNKVGGDYIDDEILKHVEESHAKKFGWDIDDKLERNPGMKAKLLTQCEKAKISLSTREKVNIFISDYFHGNASEAEINFWLSREDLEKICQRIIAQGINEIDKILSTEQADIDSQTIALCLATGGMVNMPLIKYQLTEIFGINTLELSNKGDRIISEGAAWIAHDNLRLGLAKPFELLEARNSLLTIISERTLLPERGKSIISKQSMYCSDPRDGKAIFIFKRPQMVGKAGAADPRTTYSPHLVVEINPDFPPLEERIELTVTIDDNLIAHVIAIAIDSGKAIEVEYYDLEFSLIISSNEIPNKIKNRLTLSTRNNDIKQLIVRANLTSYNPRKYNTYEEEYAWRTVPGELLHAFNNDPKNVLLKHLLTKVQQIESVRYQPCSNCGSRWSINCCTKST
jgi:actin-like ATPase involved in cell morphogenesis